MVRSSRPVRLRPLIAATFLGACAALLAGCVGSSHGSSSDPQTAQSIEALIRQADEKRTASDLDGAEAALQQARALSPANADVFVAEGKIRLARRDLKGAIAQFNKALRVRPDSAPITFLLADAEFQDGSTLKAFRHLNRTIALDPSYAEAFTARGHIRQIAGDIDGSLADFKRAEMLTAKAAPPKKEDDVAIGPHETPAALAARPEPAPASPAAVAAPSVELPNADLLTQRAIEHAKHGENARALTEFNQAIQLTPSLDRARLARARLLAQMGDLAAAIEDCREVIRSDPENASAYLARGYVEGQMGSLEDALADLTRGIQLNPKDVTAYLDRATTRAKLHDLEGAAKDASVAASLDPSDNRAFLALGSLFSKEHAYPAAVENFKEAVRLKSDDVKALNTLAWLLATCPDAAVRSGAAAVTYSTQACERTGWKDVRYLDTFAAASASAGDFDAAIKWEGQCAANERDPKRQDEYRSRLALYQQHHALTDEGRQEK